MLPASVRPGATWIIVGSSQSATLFSRVYDEVEGLPPNDITPIIATCNAGCELVLPTIYWCSDDVACRKHYDDIVDMHELGWTWIVTSYLGLRYSPFIRPYVHHIINTVPGWRKKYHPGRYSNGRTSGCYLVQMAANHYAGEVHLIGMDGYASRAGDNVVDYFDGRTGTDNHGRTMEYYGPMMRSIFEQRPDTHFVFHGSPTYVQAGEFPNVTIRSTTP
jgi:hypothetical protein